MKTKAFIDEIKYALSIKDDINLDSDIDIDSLGNLVLITFLDENFDVRVNSEVLSSITNIRQIVDIIGVDKLEDD